MSTSAGYNFDLGNNWFLEPSADFMYSKTSVDNFTAAGAGASRGRFKTMSKASLGRLSVRAGTAIVTPNIIWQPFGSASLFHDFAGNVVTNAVSLPNSALVFGKPATLKQQTSSAGVRPERGQRSSSRDTRRSL